MTLAMLNFFNNGFGVGYGEDDIVRLDGSGGGGGSGGGSGTNTPPVCFGDDTVTTNMGQPVTVSIGGGDADLDEVTFIITSGPSDGSVDVESSTYTPDGNFFGADSFTYVATDGQVESEPCTITITVNEVRKYYVFELSGVGYQKTFAAPYKVTGYEYDSFFLFQSEVDGIVGSDIDNTIACANGPSVFPNNKPEIWETRNMRLLAGPFDTPQEVDAYRCPVPNYITAPNPICDHWVFTQDPAYSNDINSICGN